VLENRKYGEIELVRGIAAFSVVAYHFLYGFVPPGASGVLGDLGLVVERPFLFALVNGPFMVAVFFVLSSFALTAKLLRHPDPAATLIAIAKRFPRLFPLTLIGTLLPALLFVGGLMVNREAALLNGSSWLRDSAGLKLGGAWPEPSVGGAAIDAVLLFMDGVSQYNSALWTMKYELVGSLCALTAAFLMAGAARPVRDLAVTLALGIAALWVHPLCAICVGTVYLAKLMQRRPFTLDPGWQLTLLVAALILGSTYKPFPETLMADEAMRNHIMRGSWLIHGFGAMLLLVAVHGWPHGQAARHSDFAHAIGRLSFPIYVLHVPLQGSVASAIVLGWGQSAASLIAAFLASAALTVLLALPVARVDEWWMQRLKGWTARLPQPARHRIHGPQ